MARNRLCEAVAMTALFVLAIAGSAVAEAPISDARGPLARQEFDRDISMKMPGMSVVHVFRELAQVGGVPFILAFEEDPTLKIEFKAENISLRAILVSLADTYGLEYSRSDAGIVVTRKGQAPSQKRFLLGTRGPEYQFKFMVRDAEGKVWSSPPIRSMRNEPLEVTRGLQTKAGDVLMTVNCTPRSKVDEGLEVDVVVKVDGPEGSRSSSERKIFGKSETILFKSKEGTEFVLVDWSESPPR
jgi:hypothetical protein